MAIPDWLANGPLPFHEPVRRRQAGLLAAGLRVLVVSSVVSLPVHALLPGSDLARGILLGAQLAVVVASVVALWLLYRERFEASVLTLSIALQLSLGAVLLILGIRNGTAATFALSFAIVLVAGTARRRALVGVVLLTLAVFAGVVATQIVLDAPDGLMPERGVPLALFPVFITVLAVVLAGLADQLGRTLREAATQARDELRRRETAEEQLLASHRLEVIGRIAAYVAHDFNNLLTVILSSTDVAAEEARNGGDIAEELHSVQLAAERASYLTRQLLVLSRRNPVSFEVLEMSSFFGELGVLISRLIGPELRVDVRCPDDAWLVDGDRRLLEQVLINLAANAREATSNAGQLEITCRNETLREGLDGAQGTLPPGDYLRIDVTDDGAGIPDAVRDRIFEPFFTTKPAGRGTGIGLATCAVILRQHAGTITVRSEAGRGTTFSLFIPRSHAAAPVAAEPPRPATGGSETLLVVDDDDAVRRAVARSLKHLGYRVVEARSGLDAQRQLRAQDIRLVISDVLMPDGSGVELAQWLRDERPHVPLLLVSGYSDEHLGKILPDLGWSGILQKPFSRAELDARVRELIEGSVASA